MRIIEINIDEKHVSNGLKPIFMNKLGQCVLLAGKNGSGKTRLLSTVSSVLAKKPKKSVIDNIDHQIKACEKQIDSFQKHIETLRLEMARHPANNYSNKQSIIQSETNIKQYQQKMQLLQDTKNWSLMKTDDDFDRYVTVSFVPKDLNIRDCSDEGRKRLNDYTKNSFNIGIEQMKDSTFAYIQVLQERWFNATHQKSTIPAEEKNKAIVEYERLIEMVKKFLGCEIDRDIDGLATIFGFQLARSNLSNGQKVLLQYCIAIHAQGASLDDHILIIDEPENHLHPSILIELIENIKKFNTKGQMFIATHSIPLLSYFDPNDIWYMEDGLISKHGKTTEKVLESLLGDEEQIEKLKEFISLPAVQAINRYTYEALFPPNAANTGSDDPQTKQIHTAITDYMQPTGKMKVLDYGAGKGRILNCAQDDKDIFIEKIEYIAFDKYSENKDECIYTISCLYTDVEERYFNDESALKSKHDEHSFDVIIMSNVLHEIDPIDWLKMFGENGFITRRLKETGLLLLVEDHQLPHGEKAYQNGFIVLDTPELKKLFHISSEDKNFSYDDFNKDGRLKTHRIPQKYLQNATNDTRIAALQELKVNAKHKIAELRKSDEKNYKNGRLSGFWIHQLCNAELSLLDLSGN